MACSGTASGSASLVVIAAAAALASCASPPVESCPAPLDLVAWCARTGDCSVDGKPTACAEGSCELRNGARLEVAFQPLSWTLGERRDVGLYYSGLYDENWDNLVEVSLDDDRARRRPDLDSGILVTYRWDALPEEATLLTIQLQVGMANALYFEDAACEKRTLVVLGD